MFVPNYSTVVDLTEPAGTTTPRRSGSAARPCCRTEADLIVVGTNPLEDITALEDVQVVISNGRVALNRLRFGK